MKKPEIVLRVENKEIDTIDFGIVPEGTTKKMVVEIENTGDYSLDWVEIKLDHKDVVILEVPKILKPSVPQQIVFEYTPSMDAEVGLKAPLQITGSYKV